MGKASRAKQATKQPKIDHFIMTTDAYVAIRRYLGSRPHDETRECIVIMEQMPAITGDDVALREKKFGIWQEVSWREYHEHVRAAARMLYELGVRPGDCVAILSDNCPEWLYADLGAQSIGARGVGIYQTNPPPDVAYVLNDSGSKILFCEDQEQVDKAVAIATDTPSVEKIVVFDPRGTRDIDDSRLMPYAGSSSSRPRSMNSA